MRPPTQVPYGPEPSQHLLWRAGEGRDGIVLAAVHGGGWVGGEADGAFGRAVAAYAAARGWAAASLEHRVLPEATPGDQAEDVAHALAALQALLARDGQGAARVVVLAHSAGAHLAALVHVGALHARVPALRPWHASVLVDTAALDVDRLMRGPHLPLHDRAFGADPDRWQAWSPIARLQSRCAPVLLIAQSERAGVQWMNARFAAALREQGGVAEVDVLELSHARMHEGLAEGGALARRIDAFLNRLHAGTAPAAEDEAWCR